jgi:excisionase family DNA binding protein
MAKLHKPGLQQKARPEPALWSLTKSVSVTGVHRDIAYRLVKSGEWPSFRINGKIYIYRDALLKWLEQQVGKEISA